jgi:hypothetical protein
MSTSAMFETVMSLSEHVDPIKLNATLTIWSSRRGWSPSSRETEFQQKRFE